MALATGLRRGEILGLRWDDLNLEAGTLTVRQSLEQTQAGLGFKSPKTRNSKRTIHLPDALVLALVRHREVQAEMRRQLGPAYQDLGLVFTWEDGRPFRPHYITLGFSRLARRLDLPVRFHDLRHTQVTALIALGEHMKVISTRLGHSSIQITMDRYGHLLPGMDQGAAQRLNGLFQAVEPQTQE
jgi:integrase